MENKKVTRKDLTVIKAKIEVDAIVVDDKRVNLTPINYASIEQYITHADCEFCGVEFKKDYTFQKHCGGCQSDINKEKYFKLDLVEWNEEDALNVFNDDLYFFNIEDIHEYCKNNEIELKDMHLVLCHQTSFSPIDWETIEQDQTHEDWEPSDEFKAKVNEFNKWLTSQSTNTWMPTNKRVDISGYLK